MVDSFSGWWLCLSSGCLDSVPLFELAFGVDREDFQVVSGFSAEFLCPFVGGRGEDDGFVAV